MKGTAGSARLLWRLPSDRQRTVYETLWQRYLCRMLELLDGEGSLNVSSGSFVLRVVRRDMSDFASRRVDIGRYAEDVMADRVRRVDGGTLRLDCSATNYNLDEGATFDGGDICRLRAIGHRYRLRVDRYGQAPHVPVRSLYLLLRLVERMLRRRHGVSTREDALPFELVELSDDGWLTDAAALAEELYGAPPE